MSHVQTNRVESLVPSFYLRPNRLPERIIEVALE